MTDEDRRGYRLKAEAALRAKGFDPRDPRSLPEPATLLLEETPYVQLTAAGAVVRAWVWVPDVPGTHPGTEELRDG